MYSHCHVQESQGFALREVERQDYSNDLEIQQSSLHEEVVCSSSLASRQCTPSEVEEQDCDHILERQLNASPEFKGCLSLKVEEKEKRRRQYKVIASDEPPKSKGKRPPGTKKKQLGNKTRPSFTRLQVTAQQMTFMLFNNISNPTTSSVYP